MSSNNHTNPFRMEFRRYGGDRSPVADRATEWQDGWQANDGERLPVSSLRAMLQGQEVIAPAHRGGVRQGAHAQMPLLPAPQQVQDQHIEARHPYTSESTVSVAAFADWSSIGDRFSTFLFIQPIVGFTRSMLKTMQLSKSMILSKLYVVPCFIVRYTCMSLLYCNIFLFIYWYRLISISYFRISLSLYFLFVFFLHCQVQINIVVWHVFFFLLRWYKLNDWFNFLTLRFDRRTKIDCSVIYIV